jgi:hypothetical protein
VRDFTIEYFDRMLAIKAKRVDNLINYRAPTLAIATQISLPTALQIFFLTYMSDDSR